jgi:hypothetical protein
VNEIRRGRIRQGFDGTVACLGSTPLLNSVLSDELDGWVGTP